MNSSDLEVINVIIEDFVKERSALAEKIVAGKLDSFPSYRYHVGKVEQCDALILKTKTIMKRLSDQDSDDGEESAPTKLEE